MESVHEIYLRRALKLARRAYGQTSPNPLVGAVLVKRGRVVGEGWHHGAGQPHAEIEAIRDATIRGQDPKGGTLYVTLEPCCTHGRTPPCTEAIQQAGIRHVVVAATDPNPAHSGRGLKLLERQGIRVSAGILAELSARMNESFNHWIVTRTPWVTLKVAMTLDGKIATATGDSKWITSEAARAHAHELRQGVDGILVGVETVRQDNPSLTIRRGSGPISCRARFILDTRARTPLTSSLLTDAFAEQTTVVVGESASERRVKLLRQRVSVIRAPEKEKRIDLAWLMQYLGSGTTNQPVTSLLVEGGGEVHGSFLEGRLAHRFTAFYAPKVLGGRTARRAVGGRGFESLSECPRLDHSELRRFGPDLCLSGRIVYPTSPDTPPAPL